MGQDVIKYRACFLLAISLLATFTLQAQVNNEKLKKRVTIYKDAMRVDSFLNLLSKQTGIGFSFNSKKISPSKVFAMKKGNYSMAECLAQIQRSSGIHYAMMNNHIILVDNPPQEKYRLTLPPVKPTATTAAKPTARKTTASKTTGSRTVTTRKPVTTNIPDTTSRPSTSNIITDSLNRPTQSLSSVRNDSALLQNTPKPATDTAKRITKPSVADSLRASRAQAAKARQQAAVAAAAAAATKDNDESDTDPNLMIGAAFLRPDIYSMFGVGLNIQFEKFLGNKVSLTASAGYQQIFGEYVVSSILDTNGIPVKDSLQKDFAQIPVLLGARYYVVRPFYAAFEAGYTLKASDDVASFLTFSPSVGVKIPVGGSDIDVNIKYLYMNGKTTIPEKHRLQKGDFGFWCLRIAYAFK